MKNEFYFDSADNLTKIHAVEWVPEGNIKAVLQITHGMVEHIERYGEFAEYLNQYGIYVVGMDLLGHGLSVTDKDKLGFFAEKNGMECVISDIDSLRKITAEKYPDLPYFILGHSMGSFLTRQYIMRFGEGLSGTIIMGTGAQPGIVLGMGKFMCRFIALFKGWKHRSDFVNGLSFASYITKFKPARTYYDWLSRNEENVDRYCDDPLCGFVFTLNGFYTLFRAISYIQKKKNIENIPAALPLLIVSGANDPVGDFGKGVKKVYDSYKKLGKNAVMKLYEDDRHEILNEVDRYRVYADIMNWIMR